MRGRLHLNGDQGAQQGPGSTEDDAHAVGGASLPGKQFRDVHSRHGGLDRLPDSTVLGGCVRLEVIKVHMAGAAIQPEEDDAGVGG